MSRVILDSALNLRWGMEKALGQTPTWRPSFPQALLGMFYEGQESDVLFPKTRTYLRIKLFLWVALPHSSPYWNKNFSEKSSWLQGTLGVWGPWGLGEALGKSWNITNVNVRGLSLEEPCGLNLTRQINKGCLFFSLLGSSDMCVFV